MNFPSILKFDLPFAPCAVVILGWLGASPRHFHKYWQLWSEKLGADVLLTLRPTIVQTALPHLAGDSEIIRAFEKTVQPLSSERRPIFVHCLSNAGFIAFGRILHLGSHGGSKPLTSFLDALSDHKAGIIIDSAPSLPTPEIWARGLLSAMYQRTATHIETDMPLRYNMARNVSQLYLHQPPIKRTISEIHHAWTSVLPQTCRQLYLYSSGDTLIPYNAVEKFIDFQKASLHRRVYTKKWTDSDHVEHLKVHPEEYAQTVRMFISEVLTDRVN